MPSPENLIVLAPQKLMTPMLNKIFADARSVNAWTGRMTQQVSRTGVNKTILGNIGHTCGISETSFPDLIEIIRDTDPPCSLNVKHEIGDIRQYTSLDLRNSNKLDTSIYWKFANNLVAPPIFTEIIGDKLSVSSSWDIYSRCRMDLASDPVNIPAPKFVDLGLSTINALDKSASLWNHDTIVGRPKNVAHGRVLDHIFEKVTAVRDEVSESLDFIYKTVFKIWR